MKSNIQSLLMLLLSTLPAVVQAQFNYTTNNGTITITGYTGPGGAVIIPATINGHSVVAIGDYAFLNQTSVTTVTIPGSLLSIGVQAFSFCTSLTSITIPGSVSYIGDLPFYNCTGLTSITVDAANAYYSSSDGALFDKSQTTLIECPGGKVGTYAIPGSVTSIGDYAFYYCASLSSITIPSSVATIGGYAFLNCYSMTGITIPDSVTSIGWRSFDYCTGLIAITVDAANPVYSSLDGVVFNKSQTTLIRYPGGKAGSYAIPAGVTSIVDSAFYYCPNLSNVTIPGSVTSIGFAAFSFCTSLTSITIPDSVASISGYVFYNCSSLSSVTIPDNVTSIGQQAFLGCTSLTSVTIPASVVSIGFGAFIDCASLKGVFFKGNPPSFFPFDGSYTFDGATNAIVYYLPGTTGWGATFAGRPAVLWNPLVQTGGVGFGVGPAGFGFNITGTADIPIVVEASTTLANADWVPLLSLNLTNGAFYFSDANWTNYPARNYRIRSP